MGEQARILFSSHWYRVSYFIRLDRDMEVPGDWTPIDVVDEIRDVGHIADGFKVEVVSMTEREREVGDHGDD